MSDQKTASANVETVSPAEQKNTAVATIHHPKVIDKWIDDNAIHNWIVSLPKACPISGTMNDHLTAAVDSLYVGIGDIAKPTHAFKPSTIKFVKALLVIMSGVVKRVGPDNDVQSIKGIIPEPQLSGIISPHVIAYVMAELSTVMRITLGDGAVDTLIDAAIPPPGSKQKTYAGTCDLSVGLCIEAWLKVMYGILPLVARSQPFKATKIGTHDIIMAILANADKMTKITINSTIIAHSFNALAEFTADAKIKK